MSKLKPNKKNYLKEVIMWDAFTVSIKTLQAAVWNFSIQIWHTVSYVSHWEWISYVIKQINAPIMTFVQTILILWPKEMLLCINKQRIKYLYIILSTRTINSERVKIRWKYHGIYVSMIEPLTLSLLMAPCPSIF